METNDLDREKKKTFSGLIGREISTAVRNLGRCWVLSHQKVNSNTGIYVFKRSPCGYVELHTLNNIVVKEHHNRFAEIVLQ